MPIIANTQLTSVRKANTIMSAAFFPRVRKAFYPMLSGNFPATNLVEPFSILGAAPGLVKFSGAAKSKRLPSWTLQVPMHLYKNIVDIDRTELEGDQTRSLCKMVEQAGVQLAWLPDRVLMSKILKGHTTASVTERFNGTNYTVTIDGLPFFHPAHTTWAGGTQSNIIQTTLPATLAGVAAQAIATTVEQLQQAIQTAIKRIKTVKNNQGEPFYPELETKDSIVLLFPSGLEYYAKLAFQTAGSMIGSGVSGASGSTTNIAPTLVKDVHCSGRLDGMIDPEDESSLSPSAETCFYAFVVDDRVRPFYQANFRPPGASDLFPDGYNIDAEVSRMLREAGGSGENSITADQATLFAGSIVEHNFGAVGDRATRDVVETESMFVSARSRSNFVYGPWFTGYKFTPTGVSS